MSSFKKILLFIFNIITFITWLKMCKEGVDTNIRLGISGQLFLAGMLLWED
jgi:hypothetical protein